MKQSARELQNELNEIIDWFESDDFDIDQATEKYQRSQEVIKELAARLNDTKNKITKLSMSIEK